MIVAHNTGVMNNNNGGVPINHDSLAFGQYIQSQHSEIEATMVTVTCQNVFVKNIFILAYNRLFLHHSIGSIKVLNTFFSTGFYS